ncbi:hypothetical protein [Chitinophaga sp. LS1]|nr:hypothetical protein [Chitinophaga sp. LS1]WPV67548.1 hypothetical protein QQL36_02265 [Chitinophaga sp. LS1]
MDQIYKEQEKFDHWVVIPLWSEAEEILINKFEGHIPVVINPEF